MSTVHVPFPRELIGGTSPKMTGKYHTEVTVVSTIEGEGGSATELETVWRFPRPDKGQRVS